MWALIWVLAGCGDDEPEELRIETTCTAGTPSEFTTLDNVRIVLDQAIVTLADLELMSGAGDVLGTLPGDWEVDLLDDTLVLGEAICLEGSYAEGALHLVGRTTLAGQMTLPGSEAVAFRFEVDLADMVTAIPFTGTMNIDAPPSAIRVGMELPESLAFIDWNTPDGDGDAVLTVNDGDLAEQVQDGIISSAAWTLKLIP